MAREESSPEARTKILSKQDRSCGETQMRGAGTQGPIAGSLWVSGAMLRAGARFQVVLMGTQRWKGSTRKPALSGTCPWASYCGRTWAQNHVSQRNKKGSGRKTRKKQKEVWLAQQTVPEHSGSRCGSSMFLPTASVKPADATPKDQGSDAVSEC